MPWGSSFSFLLLFLVAQMHLLHDPFHHAYVNPIQLMQVVAGANKSMRDDNTIVIEAGWGIPAFIEAAVQLKCTKPLVGVCFLYVQKGF